MKKAKSLRVGNGAHKDTDVGPLISPEAKERAVRLITGGIHQARQVSKTVAGPVTAACPKTLNLNPCSSAGCAWCEAYALLQAWGCHVHPCDAPAPSKQVVW